MLGEPNNWGVSIDRSHIKDRPGFFAGKIVCDFTMGGIFGVEASDGKRYAYRIDELFPVSAELEVDALVREEPLVEMMLDLGHVGGDIDEG